MMREIDDVLHRVHAEFLEMPGLQLTRQQVQRLCGIDRAMCQAVLDALVEEGILCMSLEGLYKRLRHGPSRSRPQRLNLQ